MQYTNRMGETFRLQSKLSKHGKPVYNFVKKVTGTPESRLPDGYEVRENPTDGRVLLRKFVPTLILPAEKKLLEEIIQKKTIQVMSIVDTQEDSLVVYTTDPDATQGIINLASTGILSSQAIFTHILCRMIYQKMMQFTLIAPDQRLFKVSRWCFLRGFDDWMFLESDKPLPALAHKYVHHLGQKSFFKLEQSTGSEL